MVAILMKFLHFSGRNGKKNNTKVVIFRIIQENSGAKS
jgi:hypothetical protein